MNKTNQFNLTTRRYTREQMQQIVEDAGKRVFLYQVTDAFGDNGIVAAAIVDTARELPEITDLVMSCRVMGRNIENARSTVSRSRCRRKDIPDSAADISRQPGISRWKPV